MPRRIFRRRRHDEELEEELQAHLEIETRQLIERGLPVEEAERQARRLFGNQALVQEVTREVRGFVWFGRIVQDLHYALRILRRSPGFSIAAMVSLALGIGASTAVFSIADTIFLRPLPYADAGRLVWVAIRFPSFGIEFLPSPDFAAWRRDTSVFEELGATQAGGNTTMLLGGSDPEEVHVARVSFNFPAVFGATPQLGRSFRAEEELPNGPKAVLLTDGFWRYHFHASGDAVGRVVTLDGQPYTVAGVLPSSFVFPMDVKVDLLTTLPVSPTASHHGRGMSTWAVFGRLKAGVTLARAQAAAETLFATSKADAPQMFRSDTSVVVQPLQQHRAGNARTLLLVLVGAVGCLLLIACANVANLLLARWAARSRELAVRAAIGAGRARLLRHLFAETALLALGGFVTGMIVLTGILRGFVHLAAGELPRLGEVAADARVFGIAALVSAVTIFGFGGLPAIRAAGVDIHSVLQQAGRLGMTGGHRWLRRGLVALEIALSIVLLSGAALLLQTLWHMQHDHLGFQPEHVVAVTIPLEGAQRDGPRREALANEILSALQRRPGVQAAALTQCTPLSRGPITETFSRSDRPLPEPFHRGDNIGICGVGADYFQAAGMRVMRGRPFTPDDYRHPGTVAILNEAAAHAYFPGEDALGHQIGGTVNGWKTVVGVVADSKNHGLNETTMPEMFVNNPAFGNFPGLPLVFLVRAAGSERGLESDLGSGLRPQHPGLFVKFQTMDQAIGEMTASPRFNGFLLAGFAAVAFLMALVGLYGVLAFSVAERTQEIGIRIALGARRGRVLAWVMREGAGLVLSGTVAGLAGALALNRSLKALLYEITPADPATYVVVVLGLAVAAAAASWLPARRAASLDPVRALRHE